MINDFAMIGIGFVLGFLACILINQLEYAWKEYVEDATEREQVKREYDTRCHCGEIRTHICLPKQENEKQG